MANTIFEAVKKWFEKSEAKKTTPWELKIFNPLQARIGDYLMVSGVPELLERNMKNFEVREINAAVIIVGNTQFKHTDYIGYEGENWVIVRVNPIENASPQAVKQADVLLLFPDWEGAYDETLREQVLPSGILEVKDEHGNVRATYQRLNDLKEPYITKVEIVKDPNAEFPKIEDLLVWDFGRKLEHGDTEYYFVEMSQETGWFQMFRGISIPDTSIMCIPIEHNE